MTPTLRLHALAVLDRCEIEIYSSNTEKQVIYAHGSPRVTLPIIDRGFNLPTNVLIPAFANTILDTGPNVIRFFKGEDSVCIEGETRLLSAGDMVGLTIRVISHLERPCKDSDEFERIVDEIAANTDNCRIWVACTIVACALYQQYFYDSKMN